MTMGTEGDRTMIRAQRVRRLVGLGVVLLLAVVACGDDASGDAERFCETNADLGQLDDPFEVDPDEARDVVRQGRLLLDGFVSVAPEEIRESVEVAADYFRMRLDQAEAAEFDPAQLDQTDVDAKAASAETMPARAAIEDWVSANCST